MKEIADNLKRDVKELLDESANIVTGYFKDGFFTANGVVNSWKSFTRGISNFAKTLSDPDLFAPVVLQNHQPLVTVEESDYEELPTGTQLPLSEMEQLIEQLNYQWDFDEPDKTVRVVIDYRMDNQHDRYRLPFQIGRGHGTLLEQMQHYHVRGGIPKQRPRKLKGFRALYFKYLYLLGAIPIRRPRNRTAVLLRNEILRFDRYQEQFSYLMKKRIETADQLSMQYDAIQAELDALTACRCNLYKIRRSGHGGNAISEEIASLTSQLRPLRRELKLCLRIEGDIPRIQTDVQHASVERSKARASKKNKHVSEQNLKKER